MRDRTDSTTTPGRGEKRRGPSRVLGVTLEANAITSVLPDSLAAKSGLAVGAVILKVGAEEMADADEVSRALRNGPKKTSVTVRPGTETVRVAVEFEK